MSRAAIDVLNHRPRSTLDKHHSADAPKRGARGGAGGLITSLALPALMARWHRIDVRHVSGFEDLKW